jgi:hypothetical protein
MNKKISRFRKTTRKNSRKNTRKNTRKNDKKGGLFTGITRFAPNNIPVNNMILPSKPVNPIIKKYSTDSTPHTNDIPLQSLFAKYGIQIDDKDYTKIDKTQLIPYSGFLPPPKDPNTKIAYYFDESENNNSNENNVPIDSLKRNIIEDIISAIQETKDIQTDFTEEIKSIDNYQQGSSNRNDETKKFLNHVKLNISYMQDKLKTNESKTKLDNILSAVNKLHRKIK